MCVKRDEQAFPLEQGQHKNALKTEPKRFHVAVATAAEMGACVMQGLQETLGAKFLKGEKVDQNLSAPTEQQSIDRTGMFQAFESRP